MDVEARTAEVGDGCVAGGDPGAERREGFVGAVAITDGEVAGADRIDEDGRVGGLEVAEIAAEKIRLQRPG